MLIAATAEESEPIMSKTPLSPIQTDCELGLENRADSGRASRIAPKGQA